jgi:dienelactone hydrolase
MKIAQKHCLTSFLVALLLTCVTASNTLAQLKPEQGEKVTWPSVVCDGKPTVCRKMDGQGFLFAKPGQKKVVLVSHGSQGLDVRLFEYAEALQKEGFAALVIDHWTPRGITVTHNDYAAASLQGGNDNNMAFDLHTAADWLRNVRGFEKVGSIGESQGGAAAITLQKKWVMEIIDRNVSRLYAKPFKTVPIDAVVGMYGHCGFRRAIDTYANTPFLMIAGEVDDETPAKYCEALIPWMNERGGNAKIIVIPGEGHSFDAPYKRTRMYGPNPAKCNLLLDEKGVHNLNTDETIPGTDFVEAQAKCMTRGGFSSGFWKDRFVAVPHWISFLRTSLNN